jgi:small subunit ribosomal protein S20
LATHKSAEKRARQSVRRNARNTQIENAVRTFEKKVRSAIAAGNKTEAKTLLNDYMSKMSKAAIQGAYHAKTASRKIGRLAVAVNQIGAAKK